MPLIIFLVECGIELIPKEIRSQSAVKRNLSSQIYSSQLLDNALHHSAMIKLNDLEKRGRPDIAHLSILNALGSPLNKSGNLRLFVHTIKNKIFEFNSDIRISRNYNRFKGLMAKLLIDNNITANGTQLISSFNGDIQDLLSTFNDPSILQFSRKGKLIKNHNELFHEDLFKDVVAIIGGFQKSTFSNELLSLSKSLISISNYSLDAWVAVSKIINYYEMSFNII